MSKALNSLIKLRRYKEALMLAKDIEALRSVLKTDKYKDTIYQWRRVYVRENKSKLCPTLTANMGTGGHNVPLVIDNKDIRKLTPRECARFQGYDDSFILSDKLANSHIYKQIGNSVTVPVVEAIAKKIKEALKHG
jgi:DNA (cytosine-5)-methyltransferase 1